MERSDCRVIGLSNQPVQCRTEINIVSGLFEGGLNLTHGTVRRNFSLNYIPWSRKAPGLSNVVLTYGSNETQLRIPEMTTQINLQGSTCLFFYKNQ